MQNQLIKQEPVGSDDDGNASLQEDGFIVVDFAAYNIDNNRIKDEDERSSSATLDAVEVQPEDQAMQCAQCRKPFHSHRALKQHTSREHCSQARPFVCSKVDCDKAFRSRFGLKRHSMAHSGERPFSCDTCGRGFLERGHLLVHQRMHSGEKPYKCTYCQRCFAHKPHVIEHERIHSGERPYECQQCGKAFKRQTHLRNHERSMHKLVASVPN